MLQDMGYWFEISFHKNGIYFFLHMKNGLNNKTAKFKSLTYKIDSKNTTGKEEVSKCPKEVISLAAMRRPIP